ncbi:WD domain-containing protein [Diplocarpon rosae]|nr:WD domain-containing protein [Diplocarpon rosae]
MITDEEVQIVRGKSGKEKKLDASTYACIWSKDFNTGAPLLCVAGSLGVIKIINALTGDLLRTLAGHGGEINDLVISPVNHYILASASEDFTVRIWSLDPTHANQPCAAILEGDGHKDAIMSLSFHASGRYLLSGGCDHLVILVGITPSPPSSDMRVSDSSTQWTLPEFPDINTGTNIPTRIYYPHFSTSEIHQESVDWYVPLLRNPCQLPPISSSPSKAWHGGTTSSCPSPRTRTP